jgi:hypothetical protein
VPRATAPVARSAVIRPAAAPTADGSMLPSLEAMPRL